MLEKVPKLSWPEERWHDGFARLAPAERTASFGLLDLVALLRRRRRLILAVAGAVVVLVMTYVMLESPRYAASAAIILDTRKARPNEEIASLSGIGTDQTIADSQVEVIKSESVASTVLDKLKLDQDPDFFTPRTLALRMVSAVSQTVRSVLGLERSEASTRSLALDIVKTNLIVERVGTTYVITVSYGHPSPAKSAEIANAFVDAYQSRQLKAREEQSRRTATWLRTRLDELRQQSLDADFESQKLRQERTEPNAGSQTLLLLRDLERGSEIYKRLYQTFLSRYQQVIEQDALPIDEARVITRALPPVDPVYPKKPLFLALAILLGGALGTGLALLLEFFDRSIRSARDVSEHLGLPHLGSLPRLSATDRAGPRSLFDYVLRNPASPYANTMRELWVRIRNIPRSQRTKVVGFCSALPSEGKSIVASNFSFAAASSHEPVLLIDADQRNPTLHRLFASSQWERPPAPGAVAPDLQVAALVPDNGSEAVDIGELPRLLAQRIEQHPDQGCVVLDLPPLGIADVAAVAPLVDHFVLVVEWGGVPHATVRSAIESHSDIYDKCLGVLLNNVDMTKLRFYARDGESQSAESLAAAYFLAPVRTGSSSR